MKLPDDSSCSVSESPARVEGMGAIPHKKGVAFRLWAPNADSVQVAGDFNDWDGSSEEMKAEGNGYWYLNIETAKVGQEYQYVIHNGDLELWRIDPYAREVTNSIGNGVIHDAAFDWKMDEEFMLPPWNEIVIYEMHLGSFARSEDGGVGGFEDAIQKLDHLKSLGVNVIELMPVAEFAGDQSWGYNPAHIFAVESAYGGPDGLKKFVRTAHENGIGVILDVVYNHFGPSDLGLWQFDGWSENDKGGIYFYNDWRSETPWGDTRPDFGRGEVRQFIHDNVMMWLGDYHLDGLRYDMTVYVRSVEGFSEISEGWSLLQWINRDAARLFPGKILIAEDMHQNEYITKPDTEGGAAFSAQWDSAFVHPIRKALIVAEDDQRSMESVAAAIQNSYNGDAFQRVIYTESHDEVAEGRQRVPAEVQPDEQRNWFAQKRSTLGAVLTMTAPGIPMIFQGQEFLIGGEFDDSLPLDWRMSDDFQGITRLYADLIDLRLNRNCARGLTGHWTEVHHVNDQQKVIAFHRAADGDGPGDSVVVIANFSNQELEHYSVGLPHPGGWSLRLNTDWTGYSSMFGDRKAFDLEADGPERDGMPVSAEVSLAPYSALIYTNR